MNIINFETRFKEINLTIGPVEEFKLYSTNENNIWLKGIFYWYENVKKWVKIDIKDLETIKNKNFKNPKYISSILF